MGIVINGGVLSGVECHTLVHLKIEGFVIQVGCSKWGRGYNTVSEHPGKKATTQLPADPVWYGLSHFPTISEGLHYGLHHTKHKSQNWQQHTTPQNTILNGTSHSDCATTHFTISHHDVHKSCSITCTILAARLHQSLCA